MFSISSTIPSCHLILDAPSLGFSGNISLNFSLWSSFVVFVVIGFLIDQNTLYYWIHCCYRILDRSKYGFYRALWNLSDSLFSYYTSISIIAFLINQNSSYYRIHICYRILDRSKS
jgi:hypothetical protein